VKNVKLLVILARHDTSVAVLPTAACQQAIMIGPNSLFGYWTATSQNYFDFGGSAMLPSVDIQIGNDVSRGAVGQLAIDAARNLGGPDPVAGVNGIVVIPYPGSRQIPNPNQMPGNPPTITQGLDAGTTAIGGLGVSVVPVTADFTFMSHETGHVLGFSHTFGLLNNGTDWNGSDPPDIEGNVYGSPYDLMSSATFGSRWEGPPPHYSASPTFQLPSINGWPGSRSAGPNVSRALLHYTEPNATAGSEIHATYPPAGDRVLERIWAPDQDGTPRVLILHPPNEPPGGQGRVYVEYRPSRGWDAGLDLTGSQLDRAGAVIHTVSDDAGGAPHVWYRGSIPTLSADRDVAIDTTGLVVNVAHDDPNGNSVLVEVTVGARAWVDIEQRDYAVHDSGGELPVTTQRTPCFDLVTVHHINTTTTTSYVATSTGLGGDGLPGSAPVTLTWAVDGIPLVPSTTQTVVPGSLGRIFFTIVNDVLSLVSTPGQKVRAEVRVTATDGAASAVNASTFGADGTRGWMSDEDTELVAACKRKFSRWVRIKIPWLRIPIPDPPPFNTLINPAVELADWERGVRTLFEKLPGLSDTERTAIGQLVELEKTAMKRTSVAR
jgi:hypothetical protein